MAFKMKGFEAHNMHGPAGETKLAESHGEHFFLKHQGYGHSEQDSSPLKKRLRKTTKGKGRNFRTTEEGAGMTKKGVAAYRRKNPGSKLKTAVTGKVKKGSKAAKRRKSFCARSKGWKGKRGKAARRRWKC